MESTVRHSFRQSWLARSSFAALSLACSATAFAADGSSSSPSSDIVVTAAGFEQKIIDAPASISVITAEELEGRPYVTLLDAVRYLEGVDIGETRDKTGQGTVSLRGMGSDYTLILINGRRQNNNGNIYPNGFNGNQFNHIPPRDTIERIEVIRGPASTLYGADAMGGVINIITKRTLDRWSGSLTASRTFEGSKAYGDDTTVDAYLNGPVIKGLLNATARGSWYKRDASDPTYAPVVGPNGDPIRDDENKIITRPLGFGGGGKTVNNENWSAGFGLSLTPSDNHTFSFDYDVYRQKYDNAIKINDEGKEEYPVGTVDSLASIWQAADYCAGASGKNATACTGNGGEWKRRANPRVGYAPTQEFTRDTWSIAHQGDWGFGESLVSLSHVSTENKGRTMPFTVAERQLLLTMIDGTGAYTGQTEAQRKAAAEAMFLPRPARKLESAQYTLDAKLTMPLSWMGEHNFVVGGQVIRGKLNDSVFGLEDGIGGATQKNNMWSLFAEDTYRPIEAFAITGGIRYDDHAVFGSQLSPRLYGVYTISDQFTLKGGVSTGFKTPLTTQLYDGIVGFGGQGTTPQYGNPNLKPETSVSREIALYWQHPNGHGLNMTAFRNTFDDKIDNQPCGPNEIQACATLGDFAQLDYALSERATNIDKVVIQGLEISGRAKLTETLRLRANYTLTDSEQKSGAEKGLPLGNSARHMANASLDWQATDKLSFLLTGQYQSKRYRSLHPVTDKALTYRPYHIINLGAAYEATDNLRFNVRVNNLLNKDYTSYRTELNDENGDGLYDADENEILFFDDYNNKDKGRSLWVSANLRF